MNEQMRKEFDDWMTNEAKIIVGSSDPYPAGLERQYWRVWQAAWNRRAPVERQAPEWISVPREANTAMLEAMQRATIACPLNMSKVYRAAITAAPSAPGREDASSAGKGGGA